MNTPTIIVQTLDFTGQKHLGRGIDMPPVCSNIKEDMNYSEGKREDVTCFNCLRMMGDHELYLKEVERRNK
jgi:hypothetical protein